MRPLRILAFSGSLRTGSYNQKLATLAADTARKLGAEVTLVSLRDFPLPLFDEDLESREGKPAFATQLKQLFLDHDALIIASPEYNSGITGALKNAIDWVSRADTKEEPMFAAFKGKTALILSASPGEGGGARSLHQLRPLLENISIKLLPGELCVPKAYAAFDESNQLTNPTHQQQLEVLLQELVAANLHQ